MSAVEPVYAALDPRSDYPPVELVPLAARPDDLNKARILIVLGMPPGSGLKPVADAIAAEVSRQWPEAEVSQFNRRDFMIDQPDEATEIAGLCDVAVLITGPTASTTNVSALFASRLEAAGTPCSLVVFAPFKETIEHTLNLVGAPLRYSLVANPPRSEEATREAALAAVERIQAPMSPAEQQTGRRPSPRRDRVAVTGTLGTVLEEFHSRGFTDGLPIVPPTERLLAEMLAGTSRPRDTVVTETMRPEGLRVTVEMVAINAVLAGARPEYLPVILATASAFDDVEFESMTRSVNSFTFPQLVGGPIAQEIGMNGGIGALGPGWQANASIGRTLGLVLRNCGGARPGITTTNTQGNVGAYAFAFAENPASPWEPAQVTRGFSPTDSTVTVYSGGFAHHGNFGYGGLDEVAAVLGSFEDPKIGVCVMLSEKRARDLAASGMTKADVAAYLHNRSTTTIKDFRASGFYPMIRALMNRPGPRAGTLWPADYLTRPETDVVPVFPPGGIEVLVVGGDVSHTIQVWQLRHHQTVSVDEWR